MKVTVLAILLAAGMQNGKAFAGDSSCDLQAQKATQTLMSYDIGATGSITVREALNAYPQFADYLGLQSGVYSDRVLQALFIYVLKYGRIPSADFFDQVKFDFWYLERPFWRFHRTERQVLIAMKAIYSCQ